jgi:carboxyl-terminal processing protease
VEPVDDHTLMLGAIRGMLVGLDPHSEYLEASALHQLTEDTTGSYDGLGIEVTTVEGTLRVIAPIDDTPAARAGIKPGDTILRIDNVPVLAENLNDAVDMLRGPPGSEVVLSILRPGTSLAQEVKLKRETIRVASVRGRLLEPGYAYLRISQFQSETGSDLRKRVARLQKDNGTPLRGAVLDLRSNPGGLLSAAVEVSDLLLDSGTIVTTKGRIREAEMAFRATPGDALDGVPLVVLIDNGSASAAEIVAGALKDNQRGLLMGRRSFGKGSVQTVLTLDETHALKLTTARYFTPSGVSIQASGIQPDIELADLALSANEPDDFSRLRERDLRNHLRGDAEAAPESVSESSQPQAAPKDYALSEALNVLKAMALQRRPAAPAGPEQDPKTRG